MIILYKFKEHHDLLEFFNCFIKQWLYLKTWENVYMKNKRKILKQSLKERNQEIITKCLHLYLSQTWNEVSGLENRKSFTYIAILTSVPHAPIPD
jgi:hypothetical protein